MAVDKESPEAGFTLIEMLVGLALMSLIAVFIGQGIFSLRAMGSVGLRIDGTSEIAAVRDHLRRTVGEAVTDLPLTGAATFLGEPEALRFIAPADPLLEAGGLNEIVIRLEPDGSRGLALVERRRVMSGDRTADGIPTVLLSGVRALRLRYAEASATGELRWGDSWGGRGVAPALVALEVAFPKEDRRRFGVLLAHPFPSAAPPER